MASEQLLEAIGVPAAAPPRSVTVVRPCATWAPRPTTRCRPRSPDRSAGAEPGDLAQMRDQERRAQPGREQAQRGPGHGTGAVDVGCRGGAQRSPRSRHGSSLHVSQPQERGVVGDLRARGVQAGLIATATCRAPGQGTRDTACTRSAVRTTPSTTRWVKTSPLVRMPATCGTRAGGANATRAAARPALPRRPAGRPRRGRRCAPGVRAAARAGAVHSTRRRRRGAPRAPSGWVPSPHPSRCGKGRASSTGSSSVGGCGPAELAAHRRPPSRVDGGLRLEQHPPPIPGIAQPAGRGGPGGAHGFVARTTRLHAGQSSDRRSTCSAITAARSPALSTGCTASISLSESLWRRRCRAIGRSSTFHDRRRPRRTRLR